MIFNNFPPGHEILYTHACYGYDIQSGVARNEYYATAIIIVIISRRDRIIIFTSANPIIGFRFFSFFFSVFFFWYEKTIGITGGG